MGSLDCPKELASHVGRPRTRLPDPTGQARPPGRLARIEPGRGHAVGYRRGRARRCIGSIKAGNQVVVTAPVSGSTTTVIRIIDVTQLQQGFHRFFGAPPGGSAKPAVPSAS